MIHTNIDEAGNYTLDIFSWNVAEMGVQLYPETRMFRKIGKCLYEYTDNQPGTVLRTYDGPDFVSVARALKQYVCGGL